jgi:small GTP-binding protein
MRTRAEEERNTVFWPLPSFDAAAGGAFTASDAGGGGWAGSGFTRGHCAGTLAQARIRRSTARMKNIIVGTAGHIDHGKTALVRALTGIDTDRLKEEKERGISIDLGFAHLECGELRLGFVDVPGHERFIKNMLAGAAGIDIVMFVIAADESLMPQTREHFEICRLLGLRSGVIALNKADLVDPELLDLVKLELAEFFTGTFLANCPWP